MTSCAKKLQMRKCLIKIKSIYSILCCLHNMKVKDLKSKVIASLVACSIFSSHSVLFIAPTLYGQYQANVSEAATK